MNKIIIFSILFSTDLISKHFVKQNLLINQKVKLNNFLDIVYIQNFGVSFGLLSGVLSHWILIFIGLSIVFLICYLIRISKKQLEKLSYFIIIIGALSNIADRMINSFLVDFISFHYEQFYWPAFNFADIYITIGIIMLLSSFFIYIKES